MNHSDLRPCLAAFLTAIVVAVGLLSLSSAPAWAAAGTITEFTIPTKGTPFDITAGPDGNLWFTEDIGNKIGRITPRGSFTEFPVPTASSGPRGITAGPDGNLWFTELDGNKIGRITTGGSFTEFQIPSTCGSSAGCGPAGITAGPDGNLWFTEFDGGNIARITPSGSFTGAFHIPTRTSRPYGITAGPDGNLWFTEQIANKIGRITTQ
jgi:streptogramin lyase